LNYKENWYAKKMRDKKVSEKKRKFTRKVKKMKKQLGVSDVIPPDAFSSFDNFINTVKTLSGIGSVDELFDHIEAMSALLVAISDANSTTGIISSIILYAKVHVKGSLIGHCKDYITEVLTEPQGPGEKFVESVRDIKDNWKKVKESKNFSRVSQILGLVVSLGFCNLTDLDFSIAGFKMFDTKFIKVHESCVDIFDAVLDSIAFLIDGSYECFKKKSLKPLLIDDMRSLEMDEEYNFISSAWPLIQTGNALGQLNLSNTEFDHRLESLVGKMKEIVPSLKNFDKKLMTDKIQRLLTMKNDFITMQISCGVRRAPFTIEAFGESSQGKTTLLDQLIEACLVSANLSTDKGRQATINASDKFMSTWKTSNLVAKLDDMCNTKSNFVEKAPTQWVIDLCNNEPFYAPKAELEAKGKVFVQPEIVTISTNKKDLDAYTYSHCPYSIQRRAHLVLTVRAKERFQKIHDGIKCGIDHSKVMEYARSNPDRVFDDIWDIDIETAVAPEDISHIASYAPYVFEGEDMINVSFQKLVQVTLHEFHKHREHQQVVVNDMNTRKSRAQVCGQELSDGSKCSNICGICPHHDNFKPLNNSPYIYNGYKVENCDDDEDENEAYFQAIFGTQKQKHSEKRRKEKMRKRMGKQMGVETLVNALMQTTPPPKELEFGDTTAGIISNIVPSFQNISRVALVSLECASTKLVYDMAASYTESFDWLTVIPAHWLDYPVVKQYVDKRIRENSIHKIKVFQRLMHAVTLITTAAIVMYGPWFFFLIPIALNFVCQILIVYSVQSYARQILLERVDTTSNIVKNVRDKSGKHILSACAAVGIIMLIRSAYKKYLLLKTQGNIVEPNEQEVNERDLEENPWANLVQRPVTYTSRAKTTTHQQMENLVGKNTVHGVFHYDDIDAIASVLFLRTNYLVIPYHYIEKQDTFTVTFYKSQPDKVGGSFEERIEPTNTYRVPGTDLAIVYCATGGSFKDLTQYLIDDCAFQHSFHMTYRKRDGDFIHAEGTARRQRVNNGVCQFDGLLYRNLSIATFEGLCGAVLCTAGTTPSILGIHVGGVAGTPNGCAALLTTSIWQKAFEHYDAKNFTCQVGCDGEFRTEILGKEIMSKDQETPKKSPMNYLPKNSTIEYKGRCMGAATTKSNVVKTAIFKEAEQVLQVKSKWRPPKMQPDWWGWQQCLANLAIPAKSLPYELVERAVDDYLSPLITKISSEQWKHLKPLNDKENLLGIKGKRFIDAIKKNTAIGAPLTGAKSKFMTQVASTEDYPHNFVLDDDIMNEINYTLEQYKQGKRVYSLIKAAKKDEVLGKDKCRIFYVNNMSMTWIIRKYYLPIIRFLQMNPTLSECAVGVNAESKEWEQLHNFMNKHEKLIGGDYSKYDQKIPSQLILTAFKMLVTLAKECDYSEEDIKVMQVLAADVAYAYVMFNGDLVAFTSGTHISGNSLTVILNGLVGAINLRCCFFKYNPDKKRYRDFCSIMTYGDDNNGSCDPSIKFGIKTISEFLGEYGQKYTMPDKESELVESMKPEEVEFLKRKTTYIKEIDCHVGALCEESMTKNLFMRVKSKDTELSDHALDAMNIDGVLRDAFFHGRDKYEEYRVKMKELAGKTNLTNYCELLSQDFDHRVHVWKMRYDPEYAAELPEDKAEEIVLNPF